MARYPRRVRGEVLQEEAPAHPIAGHLIVDRRQRVDLRVSRPPVVIVGVHPLPEVHAAVRGDEHRRPEHRGIPNRERGDHDEHHQQEPRALGQRGGDSPAVDHEDDDHDRGDEEGGRPYDACRAERQAGDRRPLPSFERHERVQPAQEEQREQRLAAEDRCPRQLVRQERPREPADEADRPRPGDPTSDEVHPGGDPRGDQDLDGEADPQVRAESAEGEGQECRPADRPVGGGLAVQRVARTGRHARRRTEVEPEVRLWLRVNREDPRRAERQVAAHEDGQLRLHVRLPIPFPAVTMAPRGGCRRPFLRRWS